MSFFIFKGGFNQLIDLKYDSEGAMAVLKSRICNSERGQLLKKG